MPVHRVKGGYKWGKHGHVYPTRAGAERQARAAYAHGYQGKSEDDAMDLQKSVDAALRTSSVIAKRHVQSQLDSRDPFSVKESDSGEHMDLPKERVYLDEGEKAPGGVFVQEGPRGGRFYEVDVKGDAEEAQSSRKGHGSMGHVVDQPASNPEREVKPTLDTSMTVDEVVPTQSTLAKIKEALAQAKIPPATKRADGTYTPGYEVIIRDEELDVFGRGPKEKVADRVLRMASKSLEAAGLTVDFEDDVCHVKPLPGDPMMSEDDDLASDLEIGPAVDPDLGSKKSYSLDDAMDVASVLSRGVVEPSVVRASLEASRLLRSVRSR